MAVEAAVYEGCVRRCAGGAGRAAAPVFERHACETRADERDTHACDSWRENAAEQPGGQKCEGQLEEAAEHAGAEEGAKGIGSGFPTPVCCCVALAYVCDARECSPTSASPSV
jgi:hypothetical protein